MDQCPNCKFIMVVPEGKVECPRCHECYPCSQCARFREKLDREKLAKVAYEHMFPDRYGWEKETDEHLLSNYRNLADHYIKYLTE